MKIIEKNVDIEISPFKNWKDWFLTKEDKIKNVYRTPYKIYCGKTLIDEGLVPINFCKIYCSVTIENTNILPIMLDRWSLIIPEMNIIRRSDFEVSGVLHNGDSATMDFKFVIDKG